MRRSSMLFNLLGTVGLFGLLSGCGSGGTTSGSAAANTAPVIKSAPPLDGTQGTPYSYDVNATDADGDTLTYSLVPSPLAPVPFGMTINPASGLIAWTPAAQTGANQVTVQVSDGSLSSTQSFTVTVVVNPNPVAPVFITPVTLPPAFENTAYSTTVFAADANNQEITYSITTPPTGVSLVDMTINPTTGQITWTPGATQLGNKTVTIVATADGLSVIKDFTISVEIATAANGVIFGFDDLTRDGYNVTQPGSWTNDPPELGGGAYSTVSGSAIIVRGDLAVIIGSNGAEKFNQPEFIFLGVTLKNRGTTDTTFVVAGYNSSHGVTDFYYTVTVPGGGKQFRVQNTLRDNFNRPMNVSIDRLEVNGNSLFTPDFGVSCLGVGTAGGAPTCP